MEVDGKRVFFRHSCNHQQCRWLNGLCTAKARRVNQESKRVNIDFPTWVVEGLDKQAKRLGITRQALVKVWIAEKLKIAA